MVRIESFIKRKGYKNQTELARLLNVSQGTVSSWANGTSAPTHEMGRKLLRLGMTITELYDEEFPEALAMDEAFDARVYRSILRLVRNLSIIKPQPKDGTL